ncbi:Mg(2+) transport ATPase protein C [Acidisarcina polymorpha]|uniref:Mg(2+) transport ATPase protein C n=1 Tax=Acidisarcina polymorpha TaxID=2211140 RepID=A0A2Z5FRX6_9BACT|nr:MgtC/SapB family protein [Acidisarcina polymorpha]AXC09450.1 Mg(2+) transport ATPase protein C [Acidisarcina polymorpha]
MTIQQNGHMLSFSNLEQVTLTSGVAARLLIAALFGGLIGLDRELHQKPSGIRTNLLICFAASLFTFLSPIIAGENGSNKGQIASNIVQGIGFLGAGLILQNRYRVSGLTSAATVFAVASIGMACGAGLYAPATLATGVVLVALEGVGMLEKKFNVKLYLRIYEVRGKDSSEMERAILKAMDQEGRHLGDLERSTVGGLVRATFTAQATTKGHATLKKILKDCACIDEVLSFHSSEDD